MKIIERYKARLVTKGYTQTYDIDYTEIFAPVVKTNTVRILFSIDVNEKWNLYQMNVKKNTFLQGYLKEEVYMTLPSGHKRENSNLVCRLKKLIMG
jgi:Reverse transcriptase (RNA-dependent DNA polymerase)